MSSPSVAEALAAVCGYHQGDGCEHCAGALPWHRARGWTDAQIIADIELYRADFDAWADRTRQEGA